MARAVRLWAVVVAFGCAGGTADRGEGCRCTDPSWPCWPSEENIRRLNLSVGGRLAAPRSPLSSCAASGDDLRCAEQLNRSTATPFWDQRFSGGSMYTGWRGAWESSPSQLVVAARSADDIQAAVRFAARHDLRLVMKGTGSDYLGRSSAPGSLLVWTHHMQNIHWSEGDGSVTVEAGVRWGDVYDEAQARGRFVPGGQCPNVGAAGGFSLAGGWSPLARIFGTIAHSLLEAVIVNAQGEVVVANSTHNTDAFWAARGGGGGTFGVAVNLTFRTWPALAHVSYLEGAVSCPDEGSLRSATRAFLALYPRLRPEEWSDKVRWGRWSISFQLLFPRLSATAAREAFEPFLRFLADSACSASPALAFAELPAAEASPRGARVARMWPPPWKSIAAGGAPGVDRHWYNTGDRHTYVAYYVSRYIPASDLLQPDALAAKLMSLLQGPAAPSSKGASVLLQFNKALAGTAVPREDIPAPHPSAYAAGAFMDLAWEVHDYFPRAAESRATLAALGGSLRTSCSGAAGPRGRCLAPGGLAPAEVHACFEGLRACVSSAAEGWDPAGLVERLFPGAGTYVNEANYFEAEWQSRFWGDSYPRLRAVKDRLDPEGLFVCHHCVGSEDWSADGNCRVRRQAVFV